MDIALIGLAILLVLILLRMPIAFAMAIVGFLGFWYLRGFPAALAFSLQVLGYGSPFQSKGPTTCMVFHLNGLAVLVDCCPFWDLLAVKTGISIAEIDSLILTHCHEDHMGGLLKLIRRGRKIRIYTVNDIFQMMLHILSWQLDVSTEVVRQYFDFHPGVTEN